MFLKQKAIFIIMTIGFAVTAQAKAQNQVIPLPTLETGDYNLVSGEAGLCPNFTIDKNDTSAVNLSIGGSYSFITETSNHTVDSDIDPACEFREQNNRADNSDETQLTRINEEWCKGKIVSRTVSNAVISRGVIKITHQISQQVDNEMLHADPYSCVWGK